MGRCGIAVIIAATALMFGPDRRDCGVNDMIVVLPLDTIVRILDHASATSDATSPVSKRRGTRPRQDKAQPVLAKDILDALNKAKTDKANVVGPLEASHFNDLSAWCRSMGLTTEGETVEAAVRASG